MAVIDVGSREFGAIADDGRDDTAAIQRAIDAASAGDTIRLGAGTYIVSGDGVASHGALMLKSGVTLAGAGMGETVLKLADGHDGKLTGIVRTPGGDTRVADVTIRDLSIDGNSANTSGEVDGIYIGAGPDTLGMHKGITIQRVEIEGCSRYGFDPHERALGLVITDSVAHHNGRDGFIVDWVRDAVLVNNLSYENGRHGFNIVTSAADVTLIGNRAYGNGVDAFVVQRGSDTSRPLTSDVVLHGNQLAGELEGLVKIRWSADVVSYDTHHADGTPVRVIAANSADVAIVAERLPAGPPPGDGDPGTDDGGEGGTAPVEEGAGGGTETAVDPAPETEPAPEPAAVVPIVLTDRLLGGTAVDRLSGGLGNDLILGLNGSDTLSGREGDDLIVGGSGHDYMFGGIGDDIIAGGSGFDRINAGAGNDFVAGGSGNDLVTGRDGEDTLLGGSGQDILHGQNGDDELWGGGDIDTLVGGDGSDRFVYATADEGGEGEVIRDFEIGEGGDVIVLGDWLTGFGADEVASFVSVEAEEAGTLISIDADGLADAAASRPLVLLLGIATDLATLLAGGQLQLPAAEDPLLG